MAPSCRSTGPPSALNSQINYDTWRLHYEEDAPHISFCGKVALVQANKGNYFFVEQPYPTWLRSVWPWDAVAAHPQVDSVIFDQCRLGARGPRGLPAKKPSIAIANSPHLIEPFRELRCDGKHHHDVNWGYSKHTRTLQVWPWALAERVVRGISTLRAAVRAHTLLSAEVPHEAAYPATGSGISPEALGELEDLERDQAPRPVGPAAKARAAARGSRAPPPMRASGTQVEEGDADGPEAGRTARKYPNCPGCRGHRHSNDPRHTQIPGQCAIPPGTVVQWKCPGCRHNPPRPREHQDHNRKPGECRWFDEPYREAGERRTGRRGAHPREARTRLGQDPVSGVPGSAISPETDGPPAERGPIADPEPPPPPSKPASAGSRSFSMISCTT